jgi:hypothetical protein
MRVNGYEGRTNAQAANLLVAFVVDEGSGITS